MGEESQLRKLEQKLLADIEEQLGLFNIEQSGPNSLKSVLDAHPGKYPASAGGQRRPITQLINRIKKESTLDYLERLRQHQIFPHPSTLGKKNMPATRSKKTPPRPPAAGANWDDDDANLGELLVFVTVVLQSNLSHNLICFSSVWL